MRLQRGVKGFVYNERDRARRAARKDSKMAGQDYQPSPPKLWGALAFACAIVAADRESHIDFCATRQPDGRPDLDSIKGLDLAHLQECDAVLAVLRGAMATVAPLLAFAPSEGISS